jgi:hypothetical protein
MPKSVAVKRDVLASAKAAAKKKKIVKDDAAGDANDGGGDYDSRVLVVDPGNIGDDNDSECDDNGDGAMFMEVDDVGGGDSDDDDEGLVIDDDYDNIVEVEGGHPGDIHT